MQDFDINTFEPLTAIKKLRIGLMEEDQVLELCTLLTTIDVINFPDFKISCFEYVNGYTFEQSMVSNTPQPEVEEELQPPPEGDENALDRSREINDGKDEEEKPHEDPIVDGTNDKHQLESEDIGPKVLSSAKPETEEQVFEDESNMEREKSAVHQDLMNQILLGMAFGFENRRRVAINSLYSRNHRAGLHRSGDWSSVPEGLLRSEDKVLQNAKAFADGSSDSCARGGAAQ